MDGGAGEGVVVGGRWSGGKGEGAGGGRRRRENIRFTFTQHVKRSIQSITNL